ncbi:hypothetical protein GALMADRAFT_217203 [Galerina marginata CBS 339.88]|uniref:Uncharacterized protein n=1 Tax=Galerina marginata (strain CBS 339.88) TaxID=685588 RepID=A0A067S833_GALM3|nr:hypothetical protein GALMADRAFT_217203 [Galerina marginata CBS 339.88]
MFTLPCFRYLTALVRHRCYIHGKNDSAQQLNPNSTIKRWVVLIGTAAFEMGDWWTGGSLSGQGGRRGLEPEETVKFCLSSFKVNVRQAAYVIWETWNRRLFFETADLSSSGLPIGRRGVWAFLDFGPTPIPVIYIMDISGIPARIWSSSPLALEGGKDDNAEWAEFG